MTRPRRVTACQCNVDLKWSRTLKANLPIARHYSTQVAPCTGNTLSILYDAMRLNGENGTVQPRLHACVRAFFAYGERYTSVPKALGARRESSNRIRVCFCSSRVRQESNGSSQGMKSHHAIIHRDTCDIRHEIQASRARRFGVLGKPTCLQHVTGLQISLASPLQYVANLAAWQLR